MRVALISVIALTLVSACGGGDDGDPLDLRPLPAMDDSRDLTGTALTVDVTARTATARLVLAPSESQAASFEIGDLTISRVFDDYGDLMFTAADSRLDVGLPAGHANVLSIDYQYEVHDDFDGAMSNGLTLTWPYYCGNLFPCRSNPDDGLSFELSLTGTTGTPVYPTAITADAPAYMLAWADADYTYINLGTTAAGTEVGVWHLPGGDGAAITGTANLVGAFQWLETTIGPYLYGPRAGSVAVAWGAGAFGGMEHHPYWHVATVAMSDEETHAHEAAHGWFGNGIRIACWEDFVLSEGTVSYLAARSLEKVAGTGLSDAIWASYATSLSNLQQGTDNKIAWPDGCNQLDILEDGLFGTAPYMKGAFFYKALANRIGADALDSILGTFYGQYAGQAARMQDLLDTVLAEDGYDAQACALAWLRSESVPDSDTCP